MRNTLLRVSFLALTTLGFLTACSDGGPRTVYSGLTLRPGATLEGNPECGGDAGTVCPRGLTCLAFVLDDVPQIRCLDVPTVCGQKFACEKGQCTVVMGNVTQLACQVE